MPEEATKTVVSRPEPRFRTGTEREILRVLWSYRGEGLVRSQILRRIVLPPKDRPTSARIGQVLQSLFAHGYLLRELDRFQGRRKTAFYRLNDNGRAVCRERYGFDKQERALFRTTEEMRQKYLTVKYFNGSIDAPARRIIGFYAYSGGLGQTSMVAHTANGLALYAERKKILVVDLDTGAPELDRFFPPTENSTEDRGLRGLLVDFHSQPDWQKKGWLQEAIQGDEYVSQPRPKEAPNLYYLRSGMENATEEVKTAERSLALNYLLAELGLAGTDSPMPAGSAEACFLPLLRQAMLERYHLVLVDSHAGRNASALALSQIADQLVVSARPSESPQTVKGLRSVIAWYLRGQEASQRPSAGVLVALHLSEYGDGHLDGLGWIRDKLLCDSVPTKRHLWLFRHNRRLQNPTDWRLTKIYEPLVKRLLGIHTDEVYLPPEVKAITIVLDPEAPMDHRILMAATLEQSNHAEFARYLETLLEERQIIPRTDTAGIEMIHKIFEVHCRRTTDIFRS